MTTRPDDSRRERMLAGWMDENFWVPLFGKAFERRDDVRTQLQGVDLTIAAPDGRLTALDEKFKYEGCLNRGLPAVGFEMSLLLDGEEREGWFGGSWAKAGIYATVFLSADVDDHTELERPEQVQAAEILWTGKKALKDWVEGFGTPMDRLMRLANGLRNSYNMGWMEKKTKFEHGAFWLTLSP